MKAICLVVVSGGVAYTYHPLHVECQVVDQDNIRDAGEGPTELMRGVGYEQLVIDAGLEEGVDFTWEAEDDPSR